MALTIAVGFIIDDAVVMIENISRHIEEGKRPFEAAMIGSQEIGFTIVSMTLSLTAVFIPLLLMGGLIGRLFREFAVTVSVAILMSGVVSLVLTPMMCAWMLQPARARSSATSRFMAWLEAGFQRSLDVYAVALRWSLRHRLFMIFVMAATMAATAWLYIVIPKGFFPQQDNGTIQGTTEAAQDISYAAMVERVHELAEVVDRRSRRRHRLLLGRRQSDRQHRPADDRPQAADASARRARPRSSTGCAARPPRSPASRCSGRRARTSRSARA